MSNPRDVPSFLDLFGRPPDVRADAPGRVNLIGEHTDYNDGYVMPIAIPQRLRVEMARRDDRRVRGFSADVGDVHMAEYVVGRETLRRSWIDYVQGLTQALTGRGCAVGGFDLRVTSEVPVGSGLSSSAALEVAVLRGLDVMFDLRLDPLEMARIGRQAENEFVGAPVGIMDQMAAALADERTALFLDIRRLTCQRVALPAGCELAVINSGIVHDHASGDYRIRRAECERASALLGVPHLRDLPAASDAWRSLPPPLDRRVRHVLTENARVLAARQAMHDQDPAALGQLLVASHESMRDDYEVSLPAIDRLVTAALGQPGVRGARLTGGGFGGCVLVLTDSGAAADVAARVVADARARRDGAPSVVVQRLPSRPRES